MANSLLVTFGCSWTEGVGICYEQGMSREEYQRLWETDCERGSFRSIIAEHFGHDHINFARAGSSNQRQFRLARDYFISDATDKYDSVTVLWGITSTARSEMFDSSKKTYENFFYHAQEPWILARLLLKHSYDHNNEVDSLSKNMQFWDRFFASHNIKNYWFDTFNTHDYTRDHRFNMIDLDDSPRDLLSQLCHINGIDAIDDNYHLSNWTVDSNRLQPLVDVGVLNPYSFHPTRLGHRQLAEFFIKRIKDSDE